jgi:hypothetical protein
MPLMTIMLDRSEADILGRLRLLADWVGTDERAAPELRVFEAAADEIERLRDQLARIGQLANSPGTVPFSPL